MQESNTWEWRRLLVNISVCLLTSHPIANVIFIFAPLGMDLKMYEDTKWNDVISNLKQFLRLICRYYILIYYVESTDETRRSM